MSREYRSSVIYAKPHKERSKSQPPLERQRPKYDPRSDAYRLYQDGRQSREQDRYKGTRYVFDNRHEARKPTAYQDHHNSHLIVHDDKRQAPRRHAERDHYNPQYQYPSGNQSRFDDPRYASPAPRQDQRYLSDNRKYQVQPNAYGHPGAQQRGYHKDYDQNPLEELFQPPEGYREVHEADVHRTDKPRPRTPDPPAPEPQIVEEKKDPDDKKWKPRKIREYRIFRKNRKEESSSESSDSSSDDEEEEDRKHGRKKHREKERGKKGGKKGDKGRHPPEGADPENWYTQTHPAKFIKLGDISYVRAHKYNKKSVEHLMSAFEAFGFVVIGVIYKGGDALLKVVAPIAAIKAYTALLSPALQALVGGVTGGVVKGLK